MQARATDLFSQNALLPMWYGQLSNEIVLHLDDKVFQMDLAHANEKANRLFEPTKDYLNNTDNLRVFAQNPSSLTPASVLSQLAATFAALQSQLSAVLTEKWSRWLLAVSIKVSFKIKNSIKKRSLLCPLKVQK